MNEPNSDRNRTPLIVVLFDLLNLLTEPNKMAAQHFLSIWRQSGRTFPEFQISNYSDGMSSRSADSTYDLQYEMYRFILSMSSSPTDSPFSPVFEFGRFIWMFITCLAIV
jgi:hypothetical protein